jgi:predicted CXXCH cytochrome family protein
MPLVRTPAWPIAVILAALVGCAHPAPIAPPAPAQPAEVGVVASNLFRADYAGSATCATCHPAISAAWQGSPMHRMTRPIDTADLRAPFDGTTFRIQADAVTMEARDGARFMRLETQRGGARLFRITKVIGGRYREDFAGVEVTDAADPVRDRGRGGEQILPASFVFSTRTWRYKGYSVMLPERPGLSAGPAWARTCIGCHNTLPFASLLYDDLYGPGASGYQGSVSDALNTPWPVVATDPIGLARAIGDELAYLGAPRPDPDTPLPAVLTEAMRATRTHLRGDHLVEVGIGCEACHGGAKAHVDQPGLRPSFEPRSPLIRVVPPTGVTPTRAQWINRTCARCHTVLFSRYTWTWEGGKRRDPAPGGSATNSGEARDFLLGGCATQMSCVACHDPHAEDRKDALAALATPRGNTLCLGCHAQFGTDATLAAHTHHRTDGDGSACVACHMPRKNLGLAYELVRYHRIGAPTDDDRVLRDRPLECALCHTDATVETTVAQMEAWWGKRYDRAALHQLYGPDLAVNVLDATLARGKPHEQTVAIGVFGEHRIQRAVPAIAAQLAHKYPLVRFVARHALELITGAPVPLDPDQPAAVLTAAAQAWLRARPPAP